MQLEDYFDFLAPNDIRIKDHRIGLEEVLYEFIHRARTPEEIQQRFPTLTLEDIYAAITYYLRNKQAMDAYITDWLEYCNHAEREQELNPPPIVQKLRRAKEAIARGEKPPKIDPSELQDQIVYLSSF